MYNFLIILHQGISLGVTLGQMLKCQLCEGLMYNICYLFAMCTSEFLASDCLLPYFFNFIVIHLIKRNSGL